MGRHELYAADLTLERWNATTRTKDGAKRHYSRRRLGHAAISHYACCIEAIAARVRQADDLLPAVDADDRGHSRHPHYLDAAGHAAFRSNARRRQPVGDEHPVRGAAVAGWSRPGVYHRQGIYWQ